MRSWNTLEERAYDSNSPKIAVRVQVRDSSGTLQDWTNLNGRNIVTAIEWGDNLNQNGASGMLRFNWRPADADNLSPYFGTGRYAGFIDVVRDVVVSIKIFPPTADPSLYSWIEVFRANVDDVDLKDHPGTLPLRDLVLAELMDQFITENKAYGADDGTVDVDDVAQALIADFDKESNTLEIPVANPFQVKRYVQQKMPILRAIIDLYIQSGWDVRPIWNTVAGEFRLTAYEPDRAIVAPMHTIPIEAIEKFSQFSISSANIRNWVKVYYGASANVDAYGNDQRSVVERLRSTSPAHDSTGTPVANSSIDKYKWRFMSFSEGATSLIQTQTDAENFADFALDDLADPTFLGSVELKYLFWPVEINDFYTFEADQHRFSGNQDFAVTGYKHMIDFGSGQHRTTLSLQGKPSVGREQWFRRASFPGGNAPVDEVAPDTPNVDIRLTPLGVTATIDVTGVPDYDQVLWFVGPTSEFTPSSANLRQASRSREYTHSTRTGLVREWLKVQLRDKTGNISATAGPFSLVGKKTESAQASRPLQAKTSVGLYSDQTLSVGFGDVLKFDKYNAGEFLGDYNIETGRFFARESGTYRVAMRGKVSTTMTEGTDYYMCIIRDPDNAAVEVARATVQTGASGDELFTLEAFIPLDADDEIECQVCDAGGTHAAITFRADYTTMLVELSLGTQSRGTPYPFVEADPVFIDHGPADNFSTVNGQGRAVFRCGNGEILFTSGDAGDAHVARLHRNVVDTTKARSISISGSSDFWFYGVAEDENRNLYLCSNKEDATTNYAVRRYGQDLVQDWVSTDLGGSITPVCLAYAPSAAEPRLYLGTDEGLAGRVRSINKTTGANVGTSADLGGNVNSLARMHPDAADGGLIVAQLANAFSPDIVALEAGDVTTEVWRIELDVDVTPPGTSNDRGELKPSPEYDRVYAVGSSSNPHLYSIDGTGTVVWQRDLGDYSMLDDIDGCLSIDVHPTTGDIAVLCVYNSTELDCVVFDREGNARWSWRGLFDVDPADDPEWTSSEIGHRIAFATDGAIWVSDGSTSSIAKVLRPYAEIPDNPPSIFASELLADFDAEQLRLANGADVSAWPSKRGTGGWRLENSTAAEQPTMRARWESGTVDSVDKTQLEFAAVEFDGTHRLIGNEESTLLPDGAISVLVCEPVDLTGDYFSGYPDTGSGANTSVKLENDSGTLTLTVNEDIGGADETVYTTNSLSGLQVIGARASDHTTAGLWTSNAKPVGTAADSGTDASPDNDTRVRLAQASSASGDWFAGWVFRWIWVRPAGFSASKVCSIVHWARQYYNVPEVNPPSAGTPADLAGPTQLFTIDGAADADIVGATGRNISEGAVIARRLGEYDTHDMYKRITPSLSVTWSNDKTGLDGTNAEGSGGPAVSESGNECYVLAIGDGTYGGVSGEFILLQLDMTDGSINWGAPLDHTGGVSSTRCTAGAIAIDETRGRIYAVVGDAGDELKAVDDDGSAVAVSGNDGSVGDCAAICMAPDDSVICIIGALERAGKWTAPLTGTGTAIDGGGAGDTDLSGTFSNVATGDYSGRIEPRRDSSDNTVWLTGGYSAADDPYLMEYDPDEATVANRILQTINISDMTGLTDLGDGCVVDHQIDKDGKIYCLYLNADSGASAEYDVIRLNADGTKDIDFRSVGGLTFMAPLTYGLASRISVDESYNVIVYTRGGYAQSYSQ